MEFVFKINEDDAILVEHKAELFHVSLYESGGSSSRLHYFTSDIYCQEEI